MVNVASSPSPESHHDALRAEAAREGFDVFGVVPAEAIGDASSRLHQFLRHKWHGEMSWLESTAVRRAHPKALWPNCRSIVMLGLNGGPAAEPLARLQDANRGVIATYAKRRDYHDLIKGRLKLIASRFAAKTGAAVKVFVDTAPLMEKPLAAAAGLGWQGKHTNLVSREFGSWLLLGALATDADVHHSIGETDHCGACRRCLDICPTQAFPAPYQLDARRCISYLTIEYAGHIPLEFRKPIGNRIFGCDDCLAICPWNKFATVARDAKFSLRQNVDDPLLEDLLKLDDVAFRHRFSGTPIKRTGRNRFLRNVLIAAGNSRNLGLTAEVCNCLDDAAALVRAMAVWAASQLLPRRQIIGLAAHYVPRETDVYVQREWSRATNQS